jgi:uncharacterized protein
MIRFDVSALLEARPGATLNLDIDTGATRLADLEVGFLRGAVGVTRVENGLLVQGTVASQLRVDCVRCLESFDLTVALELEETFRLPGTGPILGVSYAVTSNGWLDLAPLLRELAWLTIPLKPLCASACRGLCSGCGADLNVEACTCEELEVDPRWAALRDLVL